MSDVQEIEEYGQQQSRWGPSGGRPPTGAWPPCPPGPGLSPWPAGLFRLEQCWQDVKATKAALRRIIADIIAEDPNLIGLAQPIVGVTDGSPPQPGQVGEYVTWSATLPYPAAAAQLAQPATLGVLQPGDWQMQMWGLGTTALTGVSFRLTPLPDGFEHDMATLAAGGAEQETLVGPQARALTLVPSLVVGLVTLTNDSTTTPGEFNLHFWARRMR